MPVIEMRDNVQHLENNGRHCGYNLIRLRENYIYEVNPYFYGKPVAPEDKQNPVWGSAQWGLVHKSTK